MTSLTVNPEIPYNAEIPGGIQFGKMVRLQGVTHPEADRFNINFQTGPNIKPRDDTALHISVRLNQGYVARNSYRNAAWEEEDATGQLPIGKCQSWEILILVNEQNYKIAINGQHFCDFPHRISLKHITHLFIDGDVSLTLISWEEVVGFAENEITNLTTSLNSEVSRNFGPSDGYSPGNNPPLSGYIAPPGYGIPTSSAAQAESGFESFLGQAQEVLAGAIKSGAAEKLLSNFLNSGQPQQQAYVHHNAQYGQYPHQQSTQGQGPIEGLLSGILGGGGQSHIQKQTDFGGGDSLGGLGTISGLLQNVASNILHPKEQHQPQNF